MIKHGLLFFALTFATTAHAVCPPYSDGDCHAQRMEWEAEANRNHELCRFGCDDAIALHGKDISLVGTDIDTEKAQEIALEGGEIVYPSDPRWEKLMLIRLARRN